MTATPEQPATIAKPAAVPQWLSALIGIAIFGGAYMYFQADSKKQMAAVEDQVASDAVAQYEVAKRQGDPMQTCSQADLVAVAYLQAKNEAQYNAWKATEQADCSRAGIPR